MIFVNADTCDVIRHAHTCVKDIPDAMTSYCGILFDPHAMFSAHGKGLSARGLPQLSARGQKSRPWKAGLTGQCAAQKLKKKLQF